MPWSLCTDFHWNVFEKDNQELWQGFWIQSAMQEYLSIELFVHYKGFFLVNHRQSPRQGVKMAEGNCVGCGSITKHVCLKCSVPASENYLGWKECKKGDLCFKCN